MLRRACDKLRGMHDGIIFLAGDSSMDNKEWIVDWADAVNGYERFVDPPTMKRDVCYWMNAEAQRRASGLACLNTAIEATTLSNRACCSLLEQDVFIRDNITENDYLVVSVGGNDIALMPNLCTALNLVLLSWCVPVVCLEKCAVACPPNTHLDLGCAGCGIEGCLCACPCGWPPAIGYFVNLFRYRVQNYVERMLENRRPKKVFVCMIYFLDEAPTGSWADGALACMGYNCAPYRLQAAIRCMFRLATSRIRIPGTEVVAVPLFEILDGKTSADYVMRVEPSSEGGHKMANALLDAILGPSDSDRHTAVQAWDVIAPQPMTMETAG